MKSPTGQKWQGRWEQLKGRVKQAWGDLTDDDFTKADGDYDELVGIINEKTGETREELEKRLERE
jgi:uncharacterized protein YjbJ (UPF0337 family)